jgi:hypothetical protein
VAEQQVERGAGGAFGLGDLPGLTHLTEDLGLAEHGGVEPGGHLEQVRHGGVVVLAVQVRVQVVGRQAAEFAEEVADVGVGAVELLGHGVDLGAVAGAEHHGLAHVVAAAASPCNDLGNHLGCQRDALEQRQRPGAVVHSDHDDRHDDHLLPARPRRPTRSQGRTLQPTATGARWRRTGARRCSW